MTTRLLTIVFLACQCASGVEYTFVQVSDPQIGRGGFDHDVRSWHATVEHINTLDPDFVIIAGDMVENWDNQAQIDAFLEGAQGLSVPFFVVPGNHDVGDPPFFTPTPESMDLYHATHGPDYYAMWVNDDLFIAVNTNLWRADIRGETADHDDWLVNLLASAGARANRIIVFGHHPLYGSFPGEPGNTGNIPPEKRAQVLGWFTEFGVDAYLTGHRHLNRLLEYQGIDLITSAATCVNFGPPGGVPPLGFRVFTVNGQLEHYYTAIHTPDMNFDGDVDAEDFGVFQDCAIGPVIVPTLDCTACDLDSDADVDRGDWARFQRAFTGTP